MSGDPLERQVRRLLLAFPWRDRADHGGEIVGTVLDGLATDARRLPLGTAVDLVASGGLAPETVSAAAYGTVALVLTGVGAALVASGDSVTATVGGFGPMALFFALSCAAAWSLSRTRADGPAAGSDRASHLDVVGVQWADGREVVPSPPDVPQPRGAQGARPAGTGLRSADPR